MITLLSSCIYCWHLAFYFLALCQISRLFTSLCLNLRKILFLIYSILFFFALLVSHIYLICNSINASKNSIMCTIGNMIICFIFKKGYLLELCQRKKGTCLISTELYIWTCSHPVWFDGYQGATHMGYAPFPSSRMTPMHIWAGTEIHYTVHPRSDPGSGQL